MEYRAYARRMDNAHYQEALRLYRHGQLLGIPVIITTTVVGTAIFATLQQDKNVTLKIATGLLSVMAATLAALQTFFNHAGEAQKNETASTGYARLFRKFDQFLLRYEEESKPTREAALNALAELVEEMDGLEKQTPRISNRVWQDMKKKLEQE